MAPVKKVVEVERLHSSNMSIIIISEHSCTDADEQSEVSLRVGLRLAESAGGLQTALKSHRVVHGATRNC